MKIAMLIPSFPPINGGAEIGAFELCKELVKKGHQVTVLTPRIKHSFKKKETLDKVNIIRFKSGKGPFNVLYSYIYVGRLLKKIKPDFLNIQYILPSGLGGVYWAKKLKIPVITTLIGWDVYDPHIKVPSVLNPFIKRALKRSDWVATSSTFVKNIVHKKFDIEKVQVITYGIDTDRFNPQNDGKDVRKKYGVKDDEVLISTIQRLDVRKGIQYFIKAIPLIIKQVKKEKIKFMIVGDGPERDNLKQEAKKQGLQDKIIFTGNIPNAEVTKYYAACDIFAFHSLHEGFGIVLIEALSTGKPVVTTIAGGTTDIVEDGVNGFLVKPKRPKDFADRVVRLVEDEKLRQKFGENGRKKAVDQFIWSKIADKYLKTYEKIIS
ncbi:MAG: glycosyltransferase family 4 protein [archaeon]